MSGPKTSIYSLSAEQRRRLEIQRQMERYRAAIIGEMDIFKVETAQAIELKQREHTDRGWETVAKTRREQIEKIISMCNSMSTLSRLDEMEQKLSDTQTVFRKIAQIKSEMVSLAQEISRSLEESFDKNINLGRNLEFSFGEEGNADEPDITSVMDESINDYSEQFNNLKKMELPIQLQEEIARIEKIYADYLSKGMHGFYAMYFAPLKSACEAYENRIKTVKIDFQELMPVYALMCDQLGIKPENFTASEVGVEKLREEIEKMEADIARADEQEYISDCVNEAMHALGYDILGEKEIITNTKQRFDNRLYRFKEGTVIHATYSCDGKISMELAGIDSVDREPRYEEKTQMCGAMRSFCDKYKEFESYLNSKGIESEHLALLEPSEEYAKIINVEKYNMRAHKNERLASKRRQKQAKRYTEG